MNRTSARPVFGSIAHLLLLAAVAGGCNTILDNRPATYDPAALSTAPANPPPDAGMPAVDDASAVPTDAGDACAAGSRTCAGSCVAQDDPAFGCGSAACEPCITPHGTAICTGGGCGVGGCDPGYADCNGDPKDGCEVDLSLASDCGKCGAACPAAKPYCASEGSGFECTNGCTQAAPLLCETQCVAPQTDPRHCGGCNNKCAPVDNADVSCADGKCAFSCKPTYHACDGRCALDTDPAACGPTCIACPAAANAIATCQSNECALQCKPGFGNCNQDAQDGCEARFATNPLHCGGCNKACPDAPNAQVSCASGACQFACNQGFADCNADPEDGCEVNLASDPLHCGNCGTSCGAGTCTNGACVAPEPPADAGP